jgi:hypothetical protein
MKIMATNGGKTASGSKNENLTIAFLANVDGDVVLDSGKTIPKMKTGWKANDEAKAKAKAVWGKLSQPEKDEITAALKPDVDAFLEKKAAFKEFTASASSLGRRIYR